MPLVWFLPNLKHYNKTDNQYSATGFPAIRIAEKVGLRRHPAESILQLFHSGFIAGVSL
jgi:hypothetical protein